MEVELASLPSAARTKLSPNLRFYKEELKKAKKDLVGFIDATTALLRRMMSNYSLGLLCRNKCHNGINY
jgi:Trm5-related predicted tRNA methylase